MNLTHDDNGNLTYDPTASTWYQYDEENRVVQIDGAWASVYLFYDALGRRVDSYTYDYYTAPWRAGRGTSSPAWPSRRSTRARSTSG